MSWGLGNLFGSLAGKNKEFEEEKRKKVGSKLPKMIN